MTVKELATWLAAFHDQDATVEVVCHSRGTGWDGDTAKSRSFDPEKHVDYTDFRGNKLVRPDAPWANTRTLLLGELNG